MSLLIAQQSCGRLYVSFNSRGEKKDRKKMPRKETQPINIRLLLWNLFSLVRQLWLSPWWVGSKCWAPVSLWRKTQRVREAERRQARGRASGWRRKYRREEMNSQNKKKTKWQRRRGGRVTAAMTEGRDGETAWVAGRRSEWILTCKHTVFIRLT